MTSVGRTGTPEDPKALKAQYEAREAKKDKDHEKQLVDLQDAHAQDMATLTTTGKDEVKRVRHEDQIKMTEQDQKHQRDIEALKAMYQKKLAKAEGDA